MAPPGLRTTPVGWRQWVRRAAFRAAQALLLAGWLGCAHRGAAPNQDPLHPPGPRGTWHLVTAGETVASVAATAGVPTEDILEINGLRRGHKLQVGELIFVLDPPIGRVAGTAEVAHARPELRSDGAPLHWPVPGARMTSPFGSREGKVHEGIDLQSPLGTPVYAAAAGEVAYAGDGVRGYGNMVVLQHGATLMTVYAHNSVVLVHEGDQVAQGQEIARIGQTGRATAPHLHFEVRDGSVPRDPLLYLPAGSP